MRTPVVLNLLPIRHSETVWAQLHLFSHEISGACLAQNWTLAPASQGGSRKERRNGEQERFR